MLVIATLPDETNLYTLAIGHLDGAAAEIFASKRAALARRLEFPEVSDDQRSEVLRLFDKGMQPLTNSR